MSGREVLAFIFLIIIQVIVTETNEVYGLTIRMPNVVPQKVRRERYFNY